MCASVMLFVTLLNILSVDKGSGGYDYRAVLRCFLCCDHTSLLLATLIA